MTARLMPVASLSLLLSACAAQYDAAEQRNLDTLVREDTPTLGDLLEEQERVVSAREEAATALPQSEERVSRPSDEEGLATAAGVEDALEQYREILKLAPEDESLRYETQRRLADLQIEASELNPRLEQRGLVSQSEAVSLYNGLLDARPNAPDNDRILYQLARAYQNLGEQDQAIATLAELTRDFPGSRLQTDARFRRAELLFRKQDYSEAGREYARVMQAKDGEGFFEQAQYKYGWSLYKQDRYEESLDVFTQILDRELPVGAVQNLEATLEVIPRAQRELVRDVLRVVSLAFVQMGGGPALTAYLQPRPVRSYEPVLYANLAELFIEKERANDAASAYYGLAERSPQHPLAPIYASKAIDIFDKAGFAEQVIRAKERYVADYALNRPFWSANSPQAAPEAYQTLVDTTRELAAHWHAVARANSGAAALSDYQRAAQYYERYVSDFPAAEDRTEMRYNWADVLYTAGSLEQSATQFALIVDNFPTHARAPESAYGLVLAREQLLRRAAPAERTARLDALVASSRQLQTKFPTHPQVATVLTRAAEELANAGRRDEALAVATDVLGLQPAAEAEQRMSAWRIVAYAHYDSGRFAEAEQSFASWLAEMPLNDPARAPLMEAQANAIYKQAVAARDAGDLRTAAGIFARVKDALPGSSLAADADYDAASAYLQLKDWPAAITALQAFRAAWPEHRLQLETTRRLAAAYLEVGDEVAAARELERLVDTPTLAFTVRRDALWQAVGLYDKNGVEDASRVGYARYFREFGSDNLARQTKSLQRLLELTPPGQPARATWLAEAIRLGSSPRANGDDSLRLLAADSQLEIAEGHLAQFSALRLSQPLERSLRPKKAAMDEALRAYQKVLDYGFVDSTTQATFRIGELYFQLAKGLMNLPPPRGLDELEVDPLGLDDMDQRYLRALAKTYR
ncbi:MAG: tetratricopeptide repeat protein, partial [Oceanococcaceae bacterium]